jgi:hypothetical protein
VNSAAVESAAVQSSNNIGFAMSHVRTNFLNMQPDDPLDHGSALVSMKNLTRSEVVQNSMKASAIRLGLGRNVSICAGHSHEGTKNHVDSFMRAIKAD